MGAKFVTNSSFKATNALTIALAAVISVALPVLASTDSVCQDKLAMNTGTTTSATTSYQDSEIKQAVEAIRQVEKQAGTKLKTKKVLRHNYKSAGNILILGGAEAFPM